MTELQPHCLPAPAALLTADRVLDIGAGIRPIKWGAPSQHVCVEPYGPYADRLQAAGYLTLRVTAREALEAAYAREYQPDAIYMLDVIEHMTREEGTAVLELAQRLAPKQIVVFTPHGFMEQHEDAWGLGGEYWQTHRSGWVPSDFPGWGIEPYANAFFAVWTR